MTSDTADEPVSEIPFTYGDRIEFLTGCWYPDKVDRVVASGTDDNVTIWYDIKLDGCSSVISVKDAKRLRPATTPDPAL